MHAMARAAARLVVERVEGRAGPDPRHILFEPRLVHRAMGCEADLICLGKGLGGGFPISACLGRHGLDPERRFHR